MDASFPRVSSILARALHEAWRQRMLSEGWRPGDSYSEEFRTHDALLPFDRLTPEQQEDAEFDAVATGVLKELAQLDVHPRGEGAPLLPSTIRKGQRVEFVGEPQGDGVVTGWSMDARYGWPHMVHVRWLDGTESSHCLAAGDLVPTEDAASER